MNYNLNALRVDIPCMFACPALTNIPEYIHAITERKYDRSYFINQAKNVFPGSLGRVCTRPCEAPCRHGYPGNGEPVNICRLKRSASDFRKARDHSLKKRKKSGKTIAVVGGGPSGLAAVRDLLLLGHDVTVFEAKDQLGGMLYLTIPEFRLPRKVIEADVAPILDLGPKICLNMILGEDVFLENLLDGYDAVLLALGCQKSSRLNVPGETVGHVFYGLEFLLELQDGQKTELGDKCLIIGGGYTAVDCARTLVRLGVPEVTMVYRRTPQDITLDPEEMHFLEMEDVTIRYLTTVTAFVPGKHGKLDEVELVRTKVEKGQIFIIEDSKRFEHFDTAIICVGQVASSQNFIPSSMKRYFKKESLMVDASTFMSRYRGLFGAGDYVNRSRSIIDAVADGRKAALGVHTYLTGDKMTSETVRLYPAVNSDRDRIDDFIPRQQERIRSDRKSRKLKTEFSCGFNRVEGHNESKRCYLCDLHYEINMDKCIYCMWCIEEAPIDCIKQVKMLGQFENGKRPYVEAESWNEIGLIYIDNDKCVRCGKCLDVCPTRCISVAKYRLRDPVFGDKV